MAFAGMMIAAAALIILGLVLVFGIIYLIVGLILRLKKRKVASTVFLILGSIHLIGLLVLVLYVVFQPKEIETRSGVVKLQKSWIKEYETCLENRDLKKLDKLLTKHPEMICYRDINAVNLIDWGLYSRDIEIMQLALDHGGKFDDPSTYDHRIFYTSLESFFGDVDYASLYTDRVPRIQEGKTTPDMIEAIAFAIDHGAALKWETNLEYKDGNFLVLAKRWAGADGEMSADDRKLINLVRDHMPKEAGQDEQEKTHANNL